MAELSFEELGKLFLKFRDSRYFRPFYLVILGLVVTGLFAFTGGSQATACLGILLIPTAVLVIPYWLGERSLKNFAVNALPVFVIALLLIAAFQTNAMLAQGPPALTSGADPGTANRALPYFTFWNGSVEPYRGGADQVYTFEVRLKVVDGNGNVVPPANLTISANISQYNVLLSSTPIVLPLQRDPSRTNTTNGSWYLATTQLPGAVYGFYFWANGTNGANQTYSGFVLEPLNSPVQDYYAFWSIYTLFDLIFPVSFYFIIVFMYWYTIRMRKMRERMMERAKGEKLDLKKGPAKDEAAEEGKEVKPAEDAASAKTKKAAAFTCTNCGADVTEADAKCPKCGAVFED